MRMRAGAATATTGGAAGGVANFKDGQIVREAHECGDGHNRVVDAHGARQVDGEAEAADFAEEDGREGIASHLPRVNE
jgi:hypothetical protein